MRPFWRKQGPSHWLGLCSLRRVQLSKRAARLLLLACSSDLQDLLIWPNGSFLLCTPVLFL